MSPDDAASADRSARIPEEVALRRMYRITSNHERTYEDKLTDLLRLGCAYFDVEAGFLTEVSDGTQYIVEAVGDHELLQAGNSCPLSEAYCRKTVTEDRALSVQHAAVEGWEQDTAYEVFGLEAYIGAKVMLEGEIYGTFCFADSEPRADPFSSAEETFVELMAEWVSYELFQRRANKRIQKQRDRLEEFVSVVSHDLRNPLNVARGRASILKKESGDEYHDHLVPLENSLERMETIIEDTLTLAQQGETVSDMEMISLTELVDDCWERVATADATIDVVDEFTIRGDRSRLKNVFENLFRNAVDHAGTEVRIRVGRDGGQRFYVEDDGPGIEESERETVFDAGHSSRPDGTGFGLTIVKRIVNAHGWEVSIADGENGGARFEFDNVDVIDG